MAGSAKPFEHFRKEAQRAAQQAEEEKKQRDVCRMTWVPNAKPTG